MKRILSVLTLFLVTICLISPVNSVHANPAKTSKLKPAKKIKKVQSTIPLMASNSTVDGVYVVLQNNTSGGSTTYYLPPNTPNPIVLGQLVASSDVYTVRLTSTGGAHDMWVYWEHRSHVTGLSVSGMSIACSSCARITIFN